MGRGGDDSQTFAPPLRSRLREREPQVSANVFSGFSEEDAHNYSRNALVQSGARPGESVVLRLSSEEQLEAAPVFVEAAASLGLGPVRVLPADYNLSNEELEEALPDLEHQLSGGGVSVSLQSFAGSSFAGHDDYFDWTDGISDSRQAAVDNYNAAASAAARDNTNRWNATMWPTKAWAESVFPDAADPDKEMADLLARATFTGDPKGARRHQEALRARAKSLSSLLDQGYSRVHIETPPNPSSDHPLNRGTDLRMEISEGSRIASTQTEDSQGRAMNVNNPSDEVYGTPIRSSVAGHFTTTRPYITLDERGESVVVEGIYGEFENGKLVKVKAFHPEHQELLQRDFQPGADPPTDVLGELGLVDSSGPLAQAKYPDGRPRTFFNNIMDENTGVHIGFGRSFTGYTGGTGDVAPPSGENGAGAHRDLVIGDETTSVSFVNKEGEERRVIRSGLWQDG